jgi:hypothetical protein
MLAVLTAISRAGAAEAFIAVMRVRASRWCRSGGEVIVVRGLWRVAKFGPMAMTTTSAPRMTRAAKPGSKMSGATRISAWPPGGVLRCRPVNGPDLVAPLGGEVDEMGAGAAGGSEYGDVHGQVLLFVNGLGQARAAYGWPQSFASFSCWVAGPRAGAGAA